MEIVLLIINFIALIVVAHRVGELRPAKVYPPAYELTPAKAHRLVRTWMESRPDDGGWPGWRFQCTCGTTGMASNIKEGNLGSEQNVVKQFSVHGELFASVDEDGWKHKHDVLKEQFAWYIKTCYCKDSNDAIIEWRNR